MGAPASSVWGANFWPAETGRSVQPRDVASAKRLIESAGWVLQGNVYEKAGERLAAEIWVRQEFPVRVKLAALVADQAKDCGMDLTVQLTDGQHFFDPDHGLMYWPHLPPGRTRPWDLVLVGTVLGGHPDPDAALSSFLTSEITTADRPLAANDSGYSNPTFDTLVEQAAGTYDVAERAELYRQALAILDQDLPQLPLFYPVERVLLRRGFHSIGGPLSFDRPGWDWRPETLVFDRPDQ
jgi:peptide/nickel transport system substrate-binding protein